MVLQLENTLSSEFSEPWELEFGTIPKETGIKTGLSGYCKTAISGKIAFIRPILAQALYKAGMNTYHPRKLLHYEKLGRYPDRGKAVMYICNPDMCSVPIEDPVLVEEQARLFRAAARNG